MTRDKIDQLWQQALGQSINAGEAVTRYHFDALVLEEAARVCDVMARWWEDNPGQNPLAGYIAASNCAASVRAMKPEVKT
jgi:hypothetical protein